MPYEIKANSYHKLVIKYEQSKSAFTIFGIKLNPIWIKLVLSPFLFFPFLLAGVFGSLPLIFITWLFFPLGFFGLDLLIKKLTPAQGLPEFKIVFSRSNSIVSIKSCGYKHPNPTTYSLTAFRGFGLKETIVKHKFKSTLAAEIFIKLEPIKGIRRDIPIRGLKYIIPLHNAQEIVAVTDTWLLGANGAISTEDNVESEELENGSRILRDFLDLG